ncbi:MAG: hypothetical protein JNG88_13420 [Phycisphaerales bacterium]|nr:hypothetical protein [Phycisphaerales bacterium]
MNARRESRSTINVGRVGLRTGLFGVAATSLVIGCLALAAVMHGCATPQPAVSRADAGRPANQSAIGLGNLRIGKTPSAGEVQLAQFLFGVEPDAGLLLLKPMDLGVGAGRLVISEGAMQRLLRWTPDRELLTDEPLNDAPYSPGAMTTALNGDILISTAEGAVRFHRGSRIAEYRIPSTGERPGRVGGLACVANEVWLTNLADHRVEVFDGAGGRHLRSIGRRGEHSGEFGLPLGVAAYDDEAFVVDMLNARVQVFDSDGNWRRNIGGRGDRLGYFGRPRTIAIGPDGIVFVTDAALQRVTAFARDGRPLAVFGGPGDSDALVLPAGIAIWSGPLSTARTAPADFETSYFVLVSEQISRPGIRAFAWRSPREADFNRPRRATALVRPMVTNPHFDKNQCGACHDMQNSRAAPIAPSETDALCLSCHDGVQAVAEAHPIARVAETTQTKTPAGWPTVDGRIGCLTCHDIRRHCDNPSRPAVNTSLVRGFDPLAPLNSCRECHVAESWRVNPHRGEAPGVNSATATCGFCHVSAADAGVAASGVEYSDKLRDAPTKLCLNCHAMHADPAPDGHLDRHVPDAILAAMRLGAVAKPPTLLPLADGAVTCATCHNPHPSGTEYAGYFKSPVVNLRSRDPADAHHSLRLPHAELCLHCHPR